MTARDAERLLDDAMAAMERERAGLLAGDLTTVAATAQAREAAMARLTGFDDAVVDAVAPRLALFRAAAARHAAALEAARDGVAKGRERLRRLKEAATRLSGYDANGAPRNAATRPVGGRRV